MFGHQDQNGSNTTNVVAGPAADATLAAPDAPADNPAPSAPAVSSDTAAGSYIMTDSPKHTGEIPATESPTPSLPAVASPDVPNTDDLLDIKQNALRQLTPLLGHLDQTPEEKFRTTMMMIQAADNQDLLKTAYEAAQKITDEKVRAQALLDVVNEINYFTQQQQPDAA